MRKPLDFCFGFQKFTIFVNFNAAMDRLNLQKWVLRTKIGQTEKKITKKWGLSQELCLAEHFTTGPPPGFITPPPRPRVTTYASARQWFFSPKISVPNRFLAQPGPRRGPGLPLGKPGPRPPARPGTGLRPWAEGCGAGGAGRHSMVSISTAVQIWPFFVDFISYSTVIHRIFGRV